ncbi:Monocarboxylate transporter 9 [Trichinella spiralis]|uniref:Monocarboxylate transporter 9 n=1 Tax=Trichinella spiralis TaxID=6334 RepID=A0A0V1BZC5_TRISP|nr:Monocarboxylate transporter 9 [Trichinella spiralis]
MHQCLLLINNSILTSRDGTAAVVELHLIFQFIISMSTEKTQKSIPFNALVARDGGYGWVVAFAAFATHVISDGFAYSFGILFPEIQRQFYASKAISSVVGAFFMALPLLVGPVASGLIEKYNFRHVTFLGASVTFVGFFVSVFTTNIYVLCVAFGILAGSGLGICCTTAIVAVTHYFDKKRGIATSFAVCGTGIGTIIFAPVTEALLNLFYWDGALFILSGISLNLFVCGALLRDPRFSHDTRKFAEKHHSHIKQFSSQHGKAVQKSQGKCHEQNKQTVYSLLATKASNVPGESSKPRCAPILLKKILSQPSAQNFQVDCGAVSDINSRQVCSVQIQYMDSGWIEPEAVCPSSVGIYYGRKFSAPEFLVRKPVILLKSLSSESASRPAKSPWSFMRKFHNQLMMLKNGKLSFFLFANFLFFSFNDIFYNNLPEYSTEFFQITKQTASLLVSIIGLVNTISVILFGALADMPQINNMLWFGFCTAVCGVCVGVIPLTSSFALICTLCVIFGFAISASASMTSLIVVELTNINQFAEAYGLVLFVQGLGNLLGTPFAGALYDITKTYEATFYVGGAGILLSGILVASMDVCSKIVSKVTLCFCKMTVQEKENPSG